LSSFFIEPIIPSADDRS